MSRKSETASPKIAQLYALLGKVPAEMRPNLAILTEDAFLFAYKDKVSISQFMSGHGPVSGLRPVRGDVMDFFAQLEFIVNQIFVGHLIPTGVQAAKFEQLLDAIDLSSKIRLLKDWSLIDGRTREIMFSLKEVRNGFAHNWDIEQIKYKGKPVVANFAHFKKDAQDAFAALIALYGGGEVDIDGLIERLATYAQP